MDVQETITNVQDKIIWNRDKGCEEKQIMAEEASILHAFIPMPLSINIIPGAFTAHHSELQTPVDYTLHD